MSPRNPFAFLDDEPPQRKTLLLLLAILHKHGDTVELSLADLTAIEDGASFHKYPDDTGTYLVLRFARKGAEAYFLSATEESPSQTKPRSTIRGTTPRSTEEPSGPRHAIHDDMDL